MTDREQKETQKRALEEQMIPISQELLKFCKEFGSDVFLVVNALHLGLYNQLSQIQRFATVDRCAVELKALRADTSLWLDVRLLIKDENE